MEVLKVKKNSYKIDVETRKLAIEFFPTFFEDNFQIATNKSIHELYDSYKKLVYVDYKPIFSDLEKDEIARLKYIKEFMNTAHGKNIKRAYDYIFINLQKKRYNRSILIGTLEQCYDDIINEICTFNFESKKKNSWSQKQNITTKNILFMLSTFEPFLYDVFINISEFINDKETSLNSKDEFYSEVCIYILKIIAELIEVKKELYTAKNKYQMLKKQNLNKKNDISYRLFKKKVQEKKIIHYHNLEKARRNWHLKRNEACHKLLEFMGLMEELNIAMYYRTFDYKITNYGVSDNVYETSIKYRNGIDALSNSSVYFSFLNEHEKKEHILNKKTKEKTS